jgi:GTP-binding protein HflX
MRRQRGTDAIVAKRAAASPVETDEIRALGAAAGYDVAGELTQTGPEDPGTYFGRGTVDALADRVAETGADAVIVDDGLTPNQSVTLRESLPDGTEVFDRYRLVLWLFADQAESNRAQLQVELARLQYALPRIRERSDVQAMNKYAEKGTPVDGVENRIADLERKLADMPDPGELFRDRRRDQGFDLVTLAGYTNAGKSTLLHRLADDLAVADAAPDHPDTDATAGIADRLFKTLETTTRKATLAGRPTLVTDTVGFVDDLPHWVVESFSETLSETAAADVVVLVVDASDELETMARKTRVSRAVLAEQDVAESAIVTALTKVDLLTATEVAERMAVLEEITPSPVPVSTTAGRNIEGLVEAVGERLATGRLDVQVPNCDAAMGLVSRAYDRANVETVEYAGDHVRIAAVGRPAVVAQLEAEAATITETPLAT